MQNQLLWTVCDLQSVKRMSVYFGPVTIPVAEVTAAKMNFVIRSYTDTNWFVKIRLTGGGYEVTSQYCHNHGYS